MASPCANGTPQGLVMQPPFDLWLSTTVAADVAATMHMSVASLAERQQRRLAAVISSAIHRSPLYRHLLKGAEPLMPTDIARAVVFAVEQPAHVGINELVVRPSGQAYP